VNRKLLRRWWLIAYGHFEDIRFGIIAAVLCRLATKGMRHAALLAGTDHGEGYGSHFLLEHLHEFTIGCECGTAAREGGTAAERARAAEVLELERGLYRRARHSIPSGAR
jgi:hypothetical protein